MSETWKGPTAVIGLLTIFTTIGIFVYQELKKNPTLERSDSTSSSLVPIDTSKLTLVDYEEKVGRWEANVDSIKQKISLYDDSLKLKRRWISKLESWISIKEEILKEQNLEDSYRQKQKIETNSLRTELQFEIADTFRYQDKSVGLLQLQSKIKDSLRRLKEYYKIQ